MYCWLEVFTLSCVLDHSAFLFLGNMYPWTSTPSPIYIKFCNRGTSSTFNFFHLISLLVLLASVLASTKPVWLNFSQHRGPTYSYNDGNKNWKISKTNWRVLQYQLQTITTTQGVTAWPKQKKNKTWLWSNDDSEIGRLDWASDW